MENHYEWLDKYLPEFYFEIGINPDYASSVIVCDGDKCYQYKNIWEKNNIPFIHGCAIYLITKFKPYCEEVRNTKNGWVPVDEWIINNYYKFKDILNKIEK